MVRREIKRAFFPAQPGRCDLRLRMALEGYIRDLPNVAAADEAKVKSIRRKLRQLADVRIALGDWQEFHSHYEKEKDAWRVEIYPNRESVCEETVWQDIRLALGEEVRLVAKAFTWFVRVWVAFQVPR